MNRVAEGFVLLKNPYNAHQVRRVSLRPEDVELIVFWTRDPSRLMQSLPSLDERGFRYYFQYTITAYPRSIEKSVPNTRRAIQTFIELSEIVGPRRVIWRYDPILVTNEFSVDEHKRVFEKIARHLDGYTERVVISFADMYKRVAANLGRIDGLRVEKDFERSNGVIDLAKYLAEVAKQSGMTIESCAEEIDLDSCGVIHGKCIDDELIRSIYAVQVSGKKDKYQRAPCGCVESVDIGQYDTCLHGCQYCYATTNHQLAARNFERHVVHSPMLVGLPPSSVEPRAQSRDEDEPQQESLF